MSAFVQGYVAEDGSVEVEHFHGIPWHDAPVPSRFHRCRVQTRGYIHYFTPVQRCACGAIRMDNHRRWLDRNSRRKGE
jgi:hypothetical protein